MKDKKDGQLIIIMGPSGVGKNAIIRGLLKRLKNAVDLPTCTSRQPRPTEKPGRDYYFLTRKEFKKGIKQNDFLEWALVHNTYYYGTSKKILKKLKNKYDFVLADIDVQGVDILRRQKIPHTSIFIKPDSHENLIKRIKKRKAKLSPAELQARLKSAQKELKQAKKYDHQVTNYQNRLPQTINKVLKIIKKNNL